MSARVLELLICLEMVWAPHRHGTIRGSYVQTRFFAAYCLIERIEKFMFVQSFEYFLEVVHVLRVCRYIVYQHQVTKYFAVMGIWTLKLFFLVC